MTRKTTQWPKVNPGDYDRWRKEFDAGPFVRKVLAKSAPPEAEQIRMMLFAAQLVPHQLTRQEVRRTWPKLNLTTRISLTDYMIACLAGLLTDKTRSVNKDIAALLTAAVIPTSKSGASVWSAEAIKKRHARIHSFSVSAMGPRFLLRIRAVSLLTARERR